MSEATAAKSNGGLRLALDYVPLIVFFVAFKLTDVFIGTAVFMVAIAAAVLISRIKLGHVSPMLWLSAILVVGFGGLTLYFHDQRFIQHKPTVIYALLATLLIGGLLTGRSLLRYVFEAGYQGLSDRGWMLLSRNWAGFFVVMALLNELIIQHFTFDQWLTIKVWGITLLSFAFGLANIPLLMRHGLDVGGNKDAADAIPPQG